MCGHPVFQDCPQCFRFFFAVFAVFVVFVFVTTDYLLGTTITDHYAHWVDYSLFYFLLISGIPLSFETGIFVKIQVLRTNRGISLESFPDFLAFPLSIERGPPFPSWCRPQKMDLSPYITPRPVPRLFTLHKTNILWDVFVFLCLCLDYDFPHVYIITLHYPPPPTSLYFAHDEYITIWCVETIC